MKPLFQRVLLKVEKLDAQDPFLDEVVKPKVFLVDAAVDCNKAVLAHIGSEVIFNGVVNEQIEEDQDFKFVLTHETNLLMI